jgi:hypothetical protein
MKIVNRTEFLKLPSETLYSSYRPQIFGELMIKGDTLPYNDFHVQYITDAIKSHSSDEWSDIVSSAEKKGTSFSMDFDCWARDGLYDDESQLYAVWEKDDVKNLLARLSKLVE